MKYTLELIDNENGSRYRLQNDKTWKIVSARLVLDESDYVTSDQYKIKDFMNRKNYEIQLNSRTILVNPHNTFSEQYCRTDLTLHRNTKARLFTRAEVESAIRNGDDSHDNFLVVTVEGEIQLLTPDHDNMFDKMSIAMRNEISIAGNNYIGEEAANDQNFVNQLYLDCLDGWVNHLETGSLNIFYDLNTTHEESELISRYNKI